MAPVLYDMDARASTTVHRREDPDAWYAAVDSDVPLVTQWDDGAHRGPGPGKLATSSSSMPSVVYALLRDLEVEGGMRVLDVGTGTGETAGALTHRLGRGRVTTVDVDGAVSAAARERLCRQGLDPEVVVGDGQAGHAATAPYDRVLATVGIRRVPPAWLRQTRPGGTILAPWGTAYGNADAMIRLRVRGGTAIGPFTRPVWFYGLTDLSWACVMFRDGGHRATVWQSGPRRLWDEVADAHRWWRGHGSPDVTRFGLTVDAHGQHAWLDDPAHEPWPLRGGG
ncbi:methyltransferase domain-containing protein [Streptomyces sp. LP11]|uniref:Protein-L-isoaspartate O-methyltransferase n=1 Tax=Streptomyces pyxinicus TaxID=2970331 RepID=A0ABT2AXZ4_9ACTN|nr:methyltransferase domain-containing protein [Streptomyces sp. LP11]MCS0600588.1 methyltransferase domain-containing protein [Streptomyces sp. LP11]